jgi:hypothetical protein
MRDLVPAIDSAAFVLAQQVPKLLRPAHPGQESLNCAGFIDIASKPSDLLQRSNKLGREMRMKIFAMSPANA